MDAVTSGSGGARAIAFTGTWREYLPIAATNVLLTIVTLGIYRFWATARQRRYLWSRTEVIGDRLEWSGTGKEMFVGFLIVMAILLPFFLFVQFLFPALIARGKETAAVGIFSLFYMGLIYLGGFARFRALRYRLSRTWWRGIRGGSDEPGWNYGGEYLGRMALTLMTLFIVWPWAATRLWNGRWNHMSFGPLAFRTNLDADGLKRRWAAVYLVPIAAMVVMMLLAIPVGASIVGGSEEASPGLMVLLGAVFLLFYLIIPLMTLHWYAKFYRKAADSLSLGGLEFGFDARTRDWLKLFLGNIALAVVTLGFGLAFWGYRNWSFMVRHMHLYGEVNVSDLTQSSTHAPGEAEGLADAFDIGAI
ncbi:YjgN family protein [Sphingomonas sp. LY29]|uniref:YjgN family protein n=1 Tax=Sphingomonas sp. LY29 TaxID=3095341 RepID=UPI002D781C65|nr:YjgN family protein [Sphingomonas sp. LY29]WRP24773.1 YjgN family protein [Sphingomonas sp. LY29]